MYPLPSFFDDLSRHGFGVAWKKRFGKISLSGREYDFKGLQQMSWDHWLWFLDQGAAAGQPLISCWAFELMLHQSGDFARCWWLVLQMISNHQEPAALEALRMLVKYADDHEWLKANDQGFWAHYLLGKIFLDDARRARGVNKQEMLTKKALALHFLGRSREVVAQGQAAAVAARPQQADLAPMALALAPVIAAAYEEGFYMAYKGTRTAATMAE